MQTARKYLPALHLSFFGLPLLLFGPAPFAPVQEVAPAPPAPPFLPVKATTTRQSIAPGVVLMQEITPADASNGPLTVSVLQVDTTRKGVHIAAALGQDRVWGDGPTLGREIVSTLAARRHAVAATNAAFFPYMGNPIGLHIEHGELITEPASARSCFLFTKQGRPHFAAFGFAGRVAIKGKPENRIMLDGLNRKPGKGDELLLFTPVFFDHTLKTPERVEVILSGMKEPLAANVALTGRVKAVSEGGNTPIATGTMVLSGGGKAAAFLRGLTIGEKITVTPTVTRLDNLSLARASFDFSDVETAAAGGPRLLTNGTVTITDTAEGFPPAFSTTRHPRTAIGTTKEGKLLFIVVDGRQKAVSRGVSLAELAQIFLRYGATDAVNLDGGGSSTLIVRDLIVSSPSDGKERPVSDALLIFGDEAKGKAMTAITTDTGDAPLTVGEQRIFHAKGKGIWGIAGGIGFVSQTGIFTAVRPGIGAILFKTDGAKEAARIAVTVIAAPTYKEPEPEDKPTKQDKSTKEDKPAKPDAAPPPPTTTPKE